MFSWKLFSVGSKQSECLGLRKKKIIGPRESICEISPLKITTSGAWAVSFLIQEKILSKLNACFQSARLQGGLYLKVVM